MWFCFQKRSRLFEPPWCVFRAARFSPNAALRKQQTSLHHFLSVPSHTANWFASFIFYLMTRRCQGDATVEVLIMHCGFWCFVVLFFFPPQKSKTTLSVQRKSSAAVSAYGLSSNGNMKKEGQRTGSRRRGAETAAWL